MSSCTFNYSAVSDGLARLPALWLRDFQPHSIGVPQERAAYSGLKGWGRTRFVIRRGRLLYAPTPPNGCVLRRTPILAWALLDVLERHPSLPDTSILFNCRDKPTYWHPMGPQPQGSYEIGTTATSKDGRPALVFSYTTGHTFTDVPLPDATFWGLPYARIPPWEQWLRGLDTADGVRWQQKRDTMLWVGTTGVGNGKLGFSSHPLRARFARCGPEVFGSRLVMHSVAKEDVDKLAWKKPPCARKAAGTASTASGSSAAAACDDTLPPSWITLREQCQHRIIVHLPGVSDCTHARRSRTPCPAAPHAGSIPIPARLSPSVPPSAPPSLFLSLAPPSLLSLSIRAMVLGRARAFQAPALLRLPQCLRDRGARAAPAGPTPRGGDAPTAHAADV